MGMVYYAFQESLRREVAIKMQLETSDVAGTLAERFNREAQVASRLISPHIVQVYAAGKQDQYLYFAMEYVRGCDLADVIKKNREEEQHFDHADALNYVIQAAEGLKVAGEQEIVHRDIKPQNLLLTDDGTLKISDFGLVKVLGENSLTMTAKLSQPRTRPRRRMRPTQ